MSVHQALANVARGGSGRHGLRIFHHGSEISRISYAELHSEAGMLASALRDRGVVSQERVAIALPTSVDFARAFFGILAAGAVPVPLPPPLRFASLDIHLRRIALALRRSKVRFVLSDATLGGLLESASSGADSGFTIVDIVTLRSSASCYADVVADDPALVQYTSGTVSDPKGVVLSHANLECSVAMAAERLGLTDADVGCSWLPLFHDMGLIGTLLIPALTGYETCLLAPEEFLRDPACWIRMISRCQGTISPAPNSGYLHTWRRMRNEPLPDADLASWRLALNGAEAVDGELLRRFSKLFAPAGFQETSFLPVYGLAEATLGVAFPPVGRSPRSVWVRRDQLGRGILALAPEDAGWAREVVSVGSPLTGLEARLVGADSMPLTGPASVGEIQIRGPSVTRGYEDHQEATRQLVHDGGWISTGDVGFWHEGELFITGRKKEMIIVRGQNYYACDVETIVGRVPGVAVHGVLAAGVTRSGCEELVLLVETRETEAAPRADLAGRVRYAVSSELGITPTDVFLLPKGQLPRTSSGKLQRGRPAPLVG